MNGVVGGLVYVLNLADADRNDFLLLLACRVYNLVRLVGAADGVRTEVEFREVAFDYG